MFDNSNHFGFIFLGDIVNETCDDQSLLIDDGVVITSVSGYYKYEPITSEDSASIYMFFRVYNDKTADCDSVYESVKYLPAASDWTLFSMDVPVDAISEIIQGQLPTHLTLACTSMKIPLGQEDIISEQGSVLWIDDLSYESIIVSVEDADALSISAFPNPASDLLKLNVPNQSVVKLAQLIDIQGRTVKQLDCNALNEAIDISDIDSGSYFVKVVAQDEVWVTTVVIER
jgi:hypothetical protein